MSLDFTPVYLAVFGCSNSLLNLIGETWNYMITRNID